MVKKIIAVSIAICIGGAFSSVPSFASTHARHSGVGVVTFALAGPPTCCEVQ